MSFSERLEVLIKEKGMTAKQLTQILKIGATSVSDWKRGKSTPSPDILIAISQLFDVSIDYLLGRTDNPNLSKELSVTPEQHKILDKFKNAPADRRKAIEILLDYDEQAAAVDKSN